MALGSNVCPLAVGETQDRDFPLDVRGSHYEVNNMQDAPDSGTTTDGRKTIVAVCKNSRGSAILPRLGILFKSTGPGWEIAGLASDNERPDGYIDPHLPSAGVADTDWCLVVLAGPTKLSHDGGNAVVFNDELIQVTAGEVDKVSADPPVVADIESFCAIAEAAVNGAGTAFNARVIARL